MELGVPALYGGERWHPAVVWNMLSNEKMKGDALIQKSYVADFLDKRQRKNKGEIHSYYVSGGHEAFIEPGLFDHVQEVRKGRNDGTRLFSGMNPWTSKLICGKCGNYFRIKKRHLKSMIRKASTVRHMDFTIAKAGRRALSQPCRRYSATIPRNCVPGPAIRMW
jgi:hypothetical protein